ncbi:MAG: GldG family protein [Opitutales bacterium]
MLNDFRHANRVHRLNRVVQVSLALCLVVLINVISVHLYRRFDLTTDQRFSLSAETKAYLQNLSAPVEIYLTEPPDDAEKAQEMVFSDLQRLLDEYEELAAGLGGGRIRIETIDVLRQHERASELAERFELDPQKHNALVVASGDRFHLVQPELLYDMTDDGRNLFKGERAITSAILKVTEAEQPTAYFLTGHGEMLPEDVDPLRGMSEAADFLKERNWRVFELQLNNRQAVPEDAELVIIAGPQNALLPIEEAHLERYLDERDGRVLMLAEPMRPHGLDDLLSDWGILVDDMIVIETDPESVVPGGDMLITRFAQHPITDLLYRGRHRLLFGLTRPARFDPAAPPDENREVQQLMGTSPQMSWAESAYERRGRPQYDRVSDLPPPVSVAIASERNRPTEVGLRRPSGRIVVIGNSNVFSNQRINAAANLIFYNQVIGWLADDDAELLQIPPREWKPMDLNLSGEEMQQMWIHLLYLPGAAFGLAAVMAMLRRR